MTALVISLALAFPVSIAAFVWLLDRQLERARIERTEILNRKVDPIAVVSSTLPPLEVPEGRMHMSEWDEQQEFEDRMSGAVSEIIG